MTKISIVGCGNHVKKNILPAIDRMNDLEVDAVYVRDPRKVEMTLKFDGVKVQNIGNSVAEDVEWVYISTPISSHYELVKSFIFLGKNVICEKPLTDSLNRTIELFELADKLNVKLYEVNMFQYHELYRHLSQVVKESYSNLICLKAKFSIPHLASNDIRYKKELGGGALLDVGYYPLTLIASMFGAPVDIRSTQFGRPEYEVDLFGAAVLDYEGFYCIAEWGIGGLYANEVEVITDTKSFFYERIFSKPNTFQTSVLINNSAGEEKIGIGADDQFANMLRSFIFSVNNHYDYKDQCDLTRCVSDLMSDIKTSSRG